MINTEAVDQSPLVNFTMKMILDGEKKIKGSSVSRISAILEDFIRGNISMNECSTILYPLIGNLEPIERLNEILTLSDTPNTSNTQPNSRSKTQCWSFIEDQKLLAAIHKYGTDDWKKVALYVGNRTKSQCSQRWFRCLDPRIKKEPWTKNQDDKLIHLIAKNGTKSWTTISFEIGNRSDIQCRYRYKQLSKEPDFHDRLIEAQEKIEKSINSKRNSIPKRVIPPTEKLSSTNSKANNTETIKSVNYSLNNSILLNQTNESNTVTDSRVHYMKNEQVIPGSYICFANNNNNINNNFPYINNNINNNINNELPNYPQQNLVPIIPVAPPPPPPMKPIMLQNPPLQNVQPVQMMNPPNQFQSPYQNPGPIQIQPMMYYQQVPAPNLVNFQPPLLLYSSPCDIPQTNPAGTLYNSIIIGNGNK
ncbi:Myb-like DNA-binding domain containing protein [Tritrichomonas foetus]|uniref:Myb-like DNA-binding domain containing protein n=1 Tax=Tritrichomonas foetus TaxID=1144522 RepID=A0A1J4J1V6_9EUKA|nr:Myb-like DNA-binding domain containing protein [Tritrichomonas foetus]|eukprot:OHS92745.1 Myb-like DNA-binding domain containing protein [Tritrichomonas foetus]